MSVRYNEDFKKEVVRAYMAGDKSTSQGKRERDRIQKSSGVYRQGN